MQIIKMDKSIQDLNKIEASFCNCSKPNVVSQMDACILQQKLARAHGMYLMVEQRSNLNRIPNTPRTNLYQ